MRDGSGEPFFAEFVEDMREFIGGQRVDQLGRGKRRCGVVPHVEGPLLLEGESSRRIVHVGRGEAEVGQEGVGGMPEFEEAAGKLREIGVDRHESGRGVDLGADARLSEREVGWVGVVEDERAAGAKTACEQHGMPAKTDRGVDEGLAGLGRERVEDLLGHDRGVVGGHAVSVPPGGRLGR